MKVRIKFAKYGTMRFISHLDLMRFFQKVIRRSGIDIAFSEGMSPHMILSFAAPLGIGVAGMAEYADIRVNTPPKEDEVLKRMNESSVEGISFLGLFEIPEGKSQKAMSVVAAADYKANFRPGHQRAAGWEERLKTFLSQESIPYEKTSKNGTRLVDIRPMIYDWQIEGETLFFRLATGSQANLKPEQIAEAFALWGKEDPDPFALEVTRLELFAKDEAGQSFLPLSALGRPL